MVRLRKGCKDDASSDEEASMGGGGSQIDDDEPDLQYGSDESDLSDLLDEELDMSLNTSAASIVSMEQAEEVVHSIVETILADVQVEGGDLVSQVHEEGEEINSGAKFLQQLDRDYLCGPRMLVRGVYEGEVLKLTVKRKTEGTYVDWTILNKKTNTLVLNVKGEMTYPYALSREAHFRPSLIYVSDIYLL